jgi:hypothetical protein
VDGLDAGSAAGAFELVTRLDTGQRRSTSFAAGLSSTTRRVHALSGLASRRSVVADGNAARRIAAVRYFAAALRR